MPVMFYCLMVFMGEEAGTSMGIDSVGWVVLRVQRVLQVELDVLQHPLDHVLDVDSFGHVRRRHDVKRRQTGIGRLGHALHDELAPETLLVHGVVPLQHTGKTTSERLEEKSRREPSPS